MAEKWLSTDIKRNPLGWFIALVMFAMFLWLLSSESALSPINNSTIANQLGCASCGPGGTAGGSYEILKPFGILFYAALPVMIGMGYLLHDKQHSPKIETDDFEIQNAEEAVNDADN